MASNLQHAKKLLRKTLKLKGKQMSNTERERESQSVIQRLVESKYFQESQRISGKYEIFSAYCFGIFCLNFAIADLLTLTDVSNDLTLLTSGFILICSIVVYLPMSDEINTLPLVKHIFERNKACFIPKYVGDTMEMVRLDSFDEIECLPLTPWNIRQPAGECFLSWLFDLRSFTMP